VTLDLTTEQTTSSPQEQLPPASTSLKILHAERQRYETYPEFQRQQCWTTKQKQALIDTILLGDPIAPLEGYQEIDILGQISWGIVDGQQRISTILAFMDGKFKTWTSGQKRNTEPNSDPPVQPGKFYEQLDVVSRNFFLDYTLQINKVRRKSESRMATRFLRIQNHMPLSAAERLNVYGSKANIAARKIVEHQFWGDFYEGKSNREQLYQASLYLIALEMSESGIADLQSWSFIHGLAAGNRDTGISDEIVERVSTRLDVVSHIFAGITFTTRPVIVPMYQSVMFLERTGYEVQAKDKKRLTKWMKGLILESTRTSGVPNFQTQIQRLLREKVQRVFWERNLKTVLSLFAIQVEAE